MSTAGKGIARRLQERHQEPLGNGAASAAFRWALALWEDTARPKPPAAVMTTTCGPAKSLHTAGTEGKQVHTLRLSHLPSTSNVLPIQSPSSPSILPGHSGDGAVIGHRNPAGPCCLLAGLLGEEWSASQTWQGPVVHTGSCDVKARLQHMVPCGARCKLCPGLAVRGLPLALFPSVQWTGQGLGVQHGLAMFQCVSQGCHPGLCW